MFYPPSLFIALASKRAFLLRRGLPTANGNTAAMELFKSFDAKLLCETLHPSSNPSSRPSPCPCVPRP